jgi:hypothetical protein
MLEFNWRELANGFSNAKNTPPEFLPNVEGVGRDILAMYANKIGIAHKILGIAALILCDAYSPH